MTLFGVFVVASANVANYSHRVTGKWRLAVQHVSVLWKESSYAALNDLGFPISLSAEFQSLVLAAQDSGSTSNKAGNISKSQNEHQEPKVVQQKSCLSRSIGWTSVSSGKSPPAWC